MRGPYPLNSTRVDLLIIPGRPGIYEVANATDSPVYLARSESDLSLALRRWVGKYKFFWFEYAVSPKDAYIIECETFHKCLKARLENNLHPGPPDNTNLKCPVCGVA
jgi:hypothetical protein